MFKFKFSNFPFLSNFFLAFRSSHHHVQPVHRVHSSPSSQQSHRQLHLITHRTRPRFPIVIGWLVCAIGALFYCYEYLLRIEPSVMVSELMRQFNVTAGSLGMMIALYYYAYTPLQLVVGILIDRYGTRFILTLAVTACALGSFMFSTASSFYVAGVGRFLIGFGSAFAFVGVLKLAAEWLPKHHFALFTGFATALGMIGAISGDVGLTMLLRDMGWQRTLYIGTAIGVILIPVVLLLVRDTPRWRAAHLGEKTSLRKAFQGFWRMVKNPQMWLVGLVACLFYLSLSVFAELWGIPFLRAVYGLSPHAAALACSMVFAGWLVGAPFSGWLSDNRKSRKLPLLVGGFLAAIIIAMVVLKPAFLTVTELYALLFLFGVFSSTEIICFAIGRENNPTHVAATAVGFTNLLTMVGGAVFQPIVGIFLDMYWDGKMLAGVREYTASDFQQAFWVLPALILLGTLLTFLIKETYHNKELDEFDKDK